ncbi:MAG: TolC family protein [Chlamydiota bacterium]
MRAGTLLIAAVSILFLRAPVCRAADPPFPGPLSLSIRETIELAYSNNKDLQIQEKEIRAARAARLGAVSPFLPQVGANGGFTHNSATLFERGNTPFAFDSEKDLGVFTGYKENINAGGTVAQSVYRGGGDYAALKKANLEIRVQEETLRARRLDVEFEAKRLYYGLLLAQENECIAEDLLTQAQAHYADVSHKYSQGTSSRFDLLQSKVHVSLLIPQLVRAQNSIELIDADLKKLLSLRMQDRIVLTEPLEHTLIAIDEESFLKRAYAQKPEMILKALGVDMGAWSIRQARATRLPQVDAALNTSFQSDELGNMFNSRHNLWSAGVNVTVPIFDGFYTTSKVDAAWARYAQAGLSKENTAEMTAVEVRRACLDLRQAQTIIDSQRDNIVEAREALRISEVAYDNGVVTNLDVLDSLVSLSQAQQYYASGIYDYLMANASLDRTLGESVVTP